MARGQRPVFMGITATMRDGVYKFDSRGVYTKANVSRETELQVAINRLRNTWDAWMDAKVSLKAARDDWQAKFLVYKEKNGTGPTVATQLAELRKQQADLLTQQADAFKNGDMAAAQTAFNGYTEVTNKIAELDGSTKNKDVTPEEQAKSAAQKVWKAAQVTEASARNAFLSTLGHALSLGATLNDKQAKEFARLVKDAPSGILPAYTDADGIVDEGEFKTNELADDSDGDDAAGASEQNGTGEGSTPSAE